MGSSDEEGRRSRRSDADETKRSRRRSAIEGASKDEGGKSSGRSGRKPRGGGSRSGSDPDEETITSKQSATEQSVSSRVSVFEEHISKSKSGESSTRKQHRGRKDGGDDATVSSRQSSAASHSNRDDHTVGSRVSRTGARLQSPKTTARSPTRKHRARKEPPADSAFSPDGFGGFPSTFSPPTARKKDPASSGADAFGNFGDAASFPPAGKADAAFSSTSTAGAFDAAFATGPELETAAGGFGAADFDPTAFNNAGFDAFDQTPAFAAQPETVWDKSPLTDVPKTKPEKLVLRQKPVLTKKFHGAPVNNPMNGNIVFAATTPKGMYLHEIDPNRSFIQVASSPILTADMKEKIATKYSATVCAVETVWSLACGIVTTGSLTKVRVAAILDLKILESPGTMRVVAVWHWSNLQQLQYVMTPPAGGDFAYDVTTLQVADGLCFLAGSSSKGACVFISKPSVREAWSANFLTGSGTVSAMTVAPDRHYLVVALTDMSVTVWTYKSALVRDSTKAQTSKRWLFPLCRLNHAKTMVAERPSSPGPDYKESTAGRKGECSGLNLVRFANYNLTLLNHCPTHNHKDAGRCTHLVWLPSDPSQPSLQLLAVGFENGFAVFHVELPIRAEGLKPIPEPTQSTVISATPSLGPIAVKRWTGSFECTFVSWLSLGPYVDPLIAVLLIDATSASVLLCAMNIPSYSKSLTAKVNMLSCRILTSKPVPKGSNSLPGGLLQSCYTSKALVYFTDERLSMITLSGSTRGLSPVASLDFPTTSSPPGLSSFGDSFLVDAKRDKDGILHIFSTVHCERLRGSSNPSMLPWSAPTRRLWLCRSVVGDTKETFVEETKEERGFGDREEATGGASADVICELDHDSLRGMTPVRIVRCTGSSVCAVLFRPAFASSRAGSGKTFSLVDADTIALVNFQDKKSTVIAVSKGRDLCFFPSGDAKSVQGLILGVDGSSLAFFDWKSKTCDLKTTFRPIVGVDNDKDYVDCKRIELFADGSKLALAALGKRERDNRFCFVTGDVCGIADATAESWSKLLPNIVSGRSAWLDENEDVLSIVGLQGDGSGYRNFALATSTRVLILSSALTVAAESKRQVACGNLAPLGSFAVCFSSDNKVRYLCCLDSEFADSGIASLRETSTNSLLAVRPDRLLFFPFPACPSLVEPGRNPNAFVLPAPNTRPALLLEAMVANAICVGGKQKQTTQVLRSVIEKFGRKVASITHGEKEGIGSSGAGLTSKTYAMLSKYGLKHAASWLLTGTPKFERSVNSEILTSWLPISAKSNGALNSDAMLHLLASGDSYLLEYIKSPEHGMPSPLPRQSDPTAYLCWEYARAALNSGKALDAMKLLDLSGAESTDSLILLISLLLEKDQHNNATGILESLGGLNESEFSHSSSGNISSSLAALAVSLKKGQKSMAEDQVDRWMKPLAPTLQRSKNTGRVRQRVLYEKALESAGGKEVEDSDPMWTSPCNESKHVW